MPVYHVNLKDNSLPVLTTHEGEEVHVVGVGGHRVWAVEFEVSAVVEDTLDAVRADPVGVRARQVREAAEAVRSKLREHIASVQTPETPVAVLLVRMPLEVLSCDNPPHNLCRTEYDDDGEVLTSEPILDADGKTILVPGRIGHHASCIVALLGLPTVPDAAMFPGEPSWMSPASGEA